MSVVFSIFPLLFVLPLIVFIIFFALTAVRGTREWNRNNHSPRLTVEAMVVAKREDVTHHQQAAGGDITGAHGYVSHYDTTYYVTFQVESGDRIEFSVAGSEYGMLVEGDQGRLTFQGTRFLGFEKQGSSGWRINNEEYKNMPRM